MCKPHKENTKKMTENKPTNKWQKGSISVTEWENTNEVNGKQVTSKSYNIQKKYVDKQGNWQTTNTLYDKDMVNLLLILLSINVTSLQKD